MSFFVKPTPPPAVKSSNIHAVSLLFAGIITVMVMAQLFSFESFPELVGQLTGSRGNVWMSVWATVIVLAEVVALPFLLRMWLSPAARFISMVAGWIVVAIWTKLSLFGLITGYGAVNSGILGATVSLPGGGWLVLFCVGLGVLAAWNAWGMWPLAKGGSGDSK